MKLKLTTALTACALILSTNIALADVAKSEKQAKGATELRQSTFTLIRANMGTLGGMAKGKIPFDAKIVERNATRIHQLSFMIADYTKTDTSGFKVKSDALPKVWTERAAFEKRIDDLTVASEKLVKISTSGDEAAIKAAIGGVGKTCGGCHDDFKKD